MKFATNTVKNVVVQTPTNVQFVSKEEFSQKHLVSHLKVTTQTTKTQTEATPHNVTSPVSNVMVHQPQIVNHVTLKNQEDH